MNFCTKCGTQLNPNVRFCGSCGAALETGKQEPRSEPLKNQPVNQAPPVFAPSDTEFKMQNTQRAVVNLWLLLTLLFVGCVFLPSTLGMDGMDGGFALSFLAGFMAMVGLIVVIIYNSRARQMAKIISGEGRLALWHYTTEEWMRFVLADFESEKTLKRNLFIVVAVIALIVGVGFSVAVGDAKAMFIIAGIMVIVAIPAFWAPRYRYRKLQHSKAVALLSENGLIIGKMFHLWIQLGASLDKVVINTEENPNLIEFSYSMPSRNGRDQQVARVPIPYGRSDEAYRLVEHFNRRISS